MQLISAFQITAGHDDRSRLKGEIIPCPPVPNDSSCERLCLHRNHLGFTYEENHLEEWIARAPSAIFWDLPVLLLGSQNYLHFPVKIDLLFVDARCRMYAVELKIQSVAKNGGVVPYDLYERQMKPYVTFLEGIGQIDELDKWYPRFRQRFGGSPARVSDDFHAAFGNLANGHLSRPVREVCYRYPAVIRGDAGVSLLLQFQALRGGCTRMNESQMIRKVMQVRARKLLLADSKLNVEECARRLAADFACPYEIALAEVNKATARMCSSARRKGAQA